MPSSPPSGQPIPPGGSSQGSPSSGTREPARRPAARSMAESATPNALTLFKAFRRRWILATFLGLVVGVLAGCGLFFFMPPPKHTVRTMIYIPKGPFLPGTVDGGVSLEDHQRTQLAMLRSRLVLNSALRDPNVVQLKEVNAKPDPLLWMEKEIQADFSIAPEILRISLTDQTTDEITVLVDGLREAYLREVVERERSLRRERLSTLGTLREKYEGQLRAGREAQKEVESKLGTKDASVRARIHAFLEQQLGMLERELLQTQSGLRKSRTELTVLEAQEKQFNNLAIPEATIQDTLNKDPAIQKLRTEAKGVKQLIQQTLERSARGENEPTVIKYRNSLSKVEKEIADEERRLRPDLVRHLRDQARADLAARLSIERGRISSLEETEKILEPEVKRLRDRVIEVANQGIKQDSFLEDMGHLNDMTRRILREEEGLKVELDAPSRVRVLEKATVIRADSSSKKAMMTGVAGLAGFAITVLGISWLEWRTRRVDHSDEVVSELGLRLVGTLPDTNLSRRRSKSAAGESTPGEHLMAESVDSCRTLLLHLARQDSLRVVMVTSAVSGEAKTALSCHLGVSVARAGQKTLLIDGDLRNPSVHRVFHVEEGPGLSEVLRGEVQLSSVTRSTAVPGLSLLPAGIWDDKAARALAQGCLGEILEPLRSQYDFILIDTSPVLPVADALLIGGHADGAIMSILRHVSRVPTVFAAARRIEAQSVRVVGAVMSGVRADVHSTYYPYRKKTVPGTSQ
jgi:polysaccharide biosynthesis transport protein